MSDAQSPAPPEAVRALAAARHPDPFAVLGPQETADGLVLTTLAPEATEVAALVDGTAHALLPHADAPGVFSGPVPRRDYRLRRRYASGVEEIADDPYRFGPVLGAQDEHFFNEGTLTRLWQRLGAHPMQHEGAQGTHFAVWAPNATRVSLVGPFNQWDGRRHPMRKRGTSGIWEIFVPDLGEGAVYKYEIVGADGVLQPLKSDPVGFGSQHAPENASVVRDIAGYGWADDDWMATRAGRNARTAPISVYEVHLGSWRRIANEDGRMLSYREAASELVDYVADLGFTHIEFLPLSEHPFDGSWGYQPVGLFAPTIRHGTPHEFRDLVEAAHRKGLGVILDWVPGHFPTDPHGLGRFDGTPLYEHADPREGFHRDWNTLIYNFGRTEVQNFLVSNALYWLDEYHVDGLRVDAVASMLYRDYSRPEGEWVPNVHGGRENLEAIDMMRRMNATTYGEAPGILTVAEESTSFPGVSHPADAGGLGFGFKWNMGWMNDTLSYMAIDPAHRPHHHSQMTFGIHYAFSENFVLPISHDEVVHGKGSMLGKMPGDRAEKFANLRAYYGFMWGHPGKKLLFMGQEFAQEAEWSHDRPLDWAALDRPDHQGVQRLVRDLNTLYRAHPALHAQDCVGEGFTWIDGGDTANSVLSFVRWSSGPDDPPVAVVVNFGRTAHDAYRLGLPREGTWQEALNTDASGYGGSNRGNMGAVRATAPGHHGQPAAAEIVLPPLSAVFLVHAPGTG